MRWENMHVLYESKQASTLDLTAVCRNWQFIHLFMHDTMDTLHGMSASNFLVWNISQNFMLRPPCRIENTVIRFLIAIV